MLISTEYECKHLLLQTEYIAEQYTETNMIAACIIEIFPSLKDCI